MPVDFCTHSAFVNLARTQLNFNVSIILSIVSKFLANVSQIPVRFLSAFRIRYLALQEQQRVSKL